jgi:heme/copper-type cytochrome/quinol oxidase subunit 2
VQWRACVRSIFTPVRQANEEKSMSTTVIYTLVAIMAVAGIFWLVVYSSGRGQEHREKTSIKPPESHGRSRSS